MSGEPCDEWVNPLAAIPSCDIQASAVTIQFQVTAGEVACPAVVTNAAVVSSPGNPDVVATADTMVWCTSDPDIVVTPTSLFAEQIPDVVSTQQMQICNEGGSTLDWSLTEVP